MECLFLQIPSHIIASITQWLSLDDIKSVRLVCTTLYRVSFCKEVFQRVHLQPRCISERLIVFTEKLLRGKFVRLSLHNLNSTGALLLLEKLPNITDLTVGMQHLSIVCSTCKFVRRLVLVDDKLVFSAEKTDDFDEHLRSLQLLDFLAEIVLYGCNQVYSIEVVALVLKYSKNLSCLSLNFLTLSSPKNSKQSVLHAILNSNKVRHWKFQSVMFLSNSSIVLPLNALTFECIDTILSPLDERHNQIEKILLDGMIPYVAKFWKKNNFVNLKSLEIRKAFFYHSKLPLCSNLRYLKLVDCHASLKYIMQLSPTVEVSLRCLSVQACDSFDDCVVLKILSKFKFLEELELVNMNKLTIALCLEIKHKTLKVLRLQGCKKIPLVNVEPIKNMLTYRVEVSNQFRINSISF